MLQLSQWIVAIVGCLIALVVLSMVGVDFYLEKAEKKQEQWRLFIDDKFIRFIENSDKLSTLPEFARYDYVLEDTRNGNGKGVIKFVGFLIEDNATFHPIIIRKVGV